MRNGISARILASALAGFAGSAQAIEPTATVVEYYNAALNHYFITAFPDEAAMLDAGVIVPGWKRTGVEWKAWAAAGDKAGTSPVCRFYGTPGIGPNSHFYTASADECALVKTNPSWKYEAVAFYIEPVQATGGYIIPPPEYLSRLQKILNERKILLVDDEIQMGFFRTGKFWDAFG